MAKIGTAKFGVNGETRSISIHEPGDFERDYLRIGLPNGNVGVLPIDNLQFARYDFLRIETADGVLGLNDKRPGTMEGFEEQSLENWYISTDAPTKITSDAGIIEDYGIVLAGEESQSTYAQRLYSHPGEGMEPLTVYPEYGMTFEYFVEFTTNSSQEGHHRLAFGVDNQNVNNYFGPITSNNANDFSNWLAIDIQAAISDVHIWRNINGERNQDVTKTFNPNAGQPYRVVVDWGDTSDNTITADIYEFHPNSSDTHMLTISNNNSNYNTNNRGIFLESEFTSAPTYFDEVREVR